MFCVRVCLCLFVRVCLTVPLYIEVINVCLGSIKKETLSHSYTHTHTHTHTQVVSVFITLHSSTMLGVFLCSSLLQQSGTPHFKCSSLPPWHTFPLGSHEHQTCYPLWHCIKKREYSMLLQIARWLREGTQKTRTAFFSPGEAERSGPAIWQIITRGKNPIITRGRSHSAPPHPDRLETVKGYSMSFLIISIWILSALLVGYKRHRE